MADQVFADWEPQRPTCAVDRVPVSVVIPTMGAERRVRNIIHLLKAMLKSPVMAHADSEVVLSHGSEHAFSLASHISAAVGAATNLSKVRHVLGPRVETFVVARFFAAAEARNEVTISMDDDVMPFPSQMTLLETLVCSISSEAGYPSYPAEYPPGLHGSQARVCTDSAKGYASLFRRGSQSLRDLAQQPGAIALTNFAGFSRTLARRFVSEFDVKWKPLLLASRGNGEDIVFATAAKLRGGNITFLSGHVRTTGAKKDDRPYSVRPDHFATRSLMCCCIASGLTGDELQKCVFEPDDVRAPKVCECSRLKLYSGHSAKTTARLRTKRLQACQATKPGRAHAAKASGPRRAASKASGPLRASKRATREEKQALTMQTEQHAHTHETAPAHKDSLGELQRDSSAFSSKLGPLAKLLHAVGLRRSPVPLGETARETGAIDSREAQKPRLAVERADFAPSRSASTSHALESRGKAMSHSMSDLEPILVKLAAGDPFCYAHFNDGEMHAIVAERPRGATDRGAQIITAELQSHLAAALTSSHPNLFVGVPCKIEFPFLHARAMAMINASATSAQPTAATLFINSNFARARDVLPRVLRERIALGARLHMVVSETANLTRFSHCTGLDPHRVLTVPVVNAFPAAFRAHQHRWRDMRAGDVAIISAGPLGRILAVEWFLHRPTATVLELGSFFDPDMFDVSPFLKVGGPRYYLPIQCGKYLPRSQYNPKRSFRSCQWAGDRGDDFDEAHVWEALRRSGGEATPATGGHAPKAA